jgi:hypothetical protein
MERSSSYLVCSAASLMLSACSGAQLTANTIDVSTTVQNIYQRQALNNLSRTIDEPFALPSQMDIQTGTITTSNAVTPSLNGPFTQGFTQTLASAATSTRTHASSLSGGTASLQGSQTWQQNWNVLPLSDANTLRNLRALYRYPIYTTDLREEYLVPRSNQNGKLTADPYMLQYPQCVLCTEQRTVNNKLKSGWLYWTADAGTNASSKPPPQDKGIVDLGHFGNHELYITQDDFERGYLADFILFLLPNAEPSGGGGGGGGAPGGAGGARTPNSPSRPNYGFPQQPVPPI